MLSSVPVQCSSFKCVTMLILLKINDKAPFSLLQDSSFSLQTRPGPLSGSRIGKERSRPCKGHVESLKLVRLSYLVLAVDD